jgi:spore maturation protein CgeB
MIYLDYSPFAHDYYRTRATGDSAQTLAFLNALEKVLIDQVSVHKPEFVLGIAQSPLFNEDFLDALRKSGIVTAFWFVEDFRVLTYWKSIASHFDIFFALQTGAFKKALEEVGAHNHYYLPAAFDGNLDETPTGDLPQSEVSFMGAPYPNRVRVFERLASRNFRIHGEGWDRYPVPGVAISGRRITESEARWIYRHTKINLNLHSSMQPEVIGGDFVNPRTFELAGLGCFQLTDRRECMPPLYAEDEMVQFDDEAELADLISYYLKNETERNEIAKKAQRRTLRNHLYEHRVSEIMDAVHQVSRT